MENKNIIDREFKPVDPSMIDAPAERETPDFKTELEGLINKYSIENQSDTPDYLLANYLKGCLKNFAITVKKRDKWFGFEPWSKLEAGQPLPVYGLDPESEVEPDEPDIEIPEDLDAALLVLDPILSDEEKKVFQEWTEKKFIACTHDNLGRKLRNDWKLWDETSVLYKWFKEKKIWHADDMSGIILISYYRRIHDLPIKLEEQIQHYLDYWKNQVELGCEDNCCDESENVEYHDENEVD